MKFATKLVFLITLEAEIWCDEVLINLNKTKIKKQTTNNQFSKMPAKANKKKPGLLVVATPSADTIATTESVLEISPGGIVTPNKDSQCSDSVLV